jgi:hypothetical protein
MGSLKHLKELNSVVVVVVVVVTTTITTANVLENDNFKLYWNRSIITDKTIPSNRPDITLTNKKTKNTFPVDIAIPNTHNLAKTITEKQKKYKNWRKKYVLCGSRTQYKWSR